MNKRKLNLLQIAEGISGLVLFAAILALCFFGRRVNAAEGSVLALDNVGVSKCWLATCGHKQVEYLVPPNYAFNNAGTLYYYTGFFLEPGVSQTVSFSQSVSQSLTVTGGVDVEVAKYSLGYTCGSTVTATVAQTVRNDSNKRKYVHLGVETQYRYTNIGKKVRTYSPAHDSLFDVNGTCTFSTTYHQQSCIAYSGCGLCLRDTSY